MKDVKDFLDCYEVVNNLEEVAKDLNKASDNVNEAMGSLEKEG